MRAALFLAALAGIGTALGLRAWGAAAALGLALFAWVALEDRRRRRFRFVDGGAKESLLEFASPPHAVIASRFDPFALFVEEHRRFTLASFEDAHWRRVIEAPQPPLAADLGPEGRLALAFAEELALFSPEGAELARRRFAAPLYRQGYQLRHSADGRWLLLHTPWFAELYPADLSAAGLRLSYEQAGHYLKYCDLTADGSRLVCAGALLLDEEAGGGIEARWGLWERGKEGWERRWARARESAANSHLRGARFGGSLALVEIYQDGYDIEAYGAEGQALWKRPGGERPVADEQGNFVLWENPYEGLTLTRLPSAEKAWAAEPGARVRHKALAPDGSSLALEGRRLVLRRASGEVRWKAWLKNDIEAFSAGPQGRLAVVSGTYGGLLRLPFEGA